MNKALIIAMLFFFLVCASYPSTSVQPDSFSVVMDGGAAVSSPALKNADGSVQLHYDLATLPDGSHSVTVKAVSTLYNKSSAASAPFVFVSGAPTTPGTITISPN
jgi:hypothetical protein